MKYGLLVYLCLFYSVCEQCSFGRPNEESMKGNALNVRTAKKRKKRKNECKNVDGITTSSLDYRGRKSEETVDLLLKER